MILDCLQPHRIPNRPEQMTKPPLMLNPLLHRLSRHLPLQQQLASSLKRHHVILTFPQRPRPTIHREPTHLHRTIHTEPPARRTRRQNLNVLRPLNGLCLQHLRVHILRITDARLRRIRDMMRQDDLPHLLTELRLPPTVVVVHAAYGVAPLRWIPVFE